MMREKQNIQEPIILFLSYAYEDEPLRAQLEKHLRLLQRQGLIFAWHNRQILAGSDWAQQVDERLDAASIILLLISSDFMDSDYCYGIEMQRALERAGRNESYVIPILLRPVDLHNAPFQDLPSLPSNNKPVTSWSNQDEAFHEIAAGVRAAAEQIRSAADSKHLPPLHIQPSSVVPNQLQRQIGIRSSLNSDINIKQSQVNIAGHNLTYVTKNFFFWKIPDRKQELYKRKLMLQRMYALWIKGVLEQSLYRFTLITLGLQEQPEAIAHPWQLIIQEFEQPDKSLPLGTHITEVYDTAGGELLILGEPGSGKTTLLLELARDMLNRATADEQHPIPVIFKLPSWAQRQSSLAIWLVDELHIMYHIDRKTGQTWVNNNNILPLLDGLDEVTEAHRSACIEAINTYRKEHGLLPMVICSRTKEYLEQSERMVLRCAVAIQPLTCHQIDEYISSGKGKLEALRNALNDDQALRELAKTPLMLSVMALTYYEGPINELIETDSIEVRRQQIFSSYVQRVTKHGRGSANEYTSQQITYWLSWLARQMLQHNQTNEVFYLERMQPDWLADRQLSTHQRLSGRLWAAYHHVGIFGTLGILLGGLPSVPEHVLFGILPGGLSNTWLGVAVSVLLGIFAGLYGVRTSEAMNELIQAAPVRFGTETLNKMQADLSISSRARQWVVSCGTFVSWVLCGILSTILISTRPGALFGVLLYGIPLWIMKMVQLVVPSQPIQSLPFHLRMAFAAAISLHIDVVLGALLGAFAGLFLPIIPTELVGGICGVVIGISVALVADPTDDITIKLAEVYRLSPWDQFLEKGRAIDPGDVIRALIVGLAIGVFVGLQTSFLSGLLSGLLATVIVLVLFQGIFALSSERLDKKYLIRPNQGFWFSIRNSILLGIFAGISCGTVIWGLTGKIFAGIVIGVLCGFFFWMSRGGGACMDYLLLRWLLRRSGATPKNYAHFLDYTVGRILLYKVGGGYIFIHRALQEYFATLENAQLTENEQLPKKKARTTLFQAFRMKNDAIDLVMQGHYEDALIALDQVLALNAKDASIWGLKGIALGHLGKLDEALAAYNQVLILNPKKMAALEEKGEVLMKLHQYEEAIATYEQYIEIVETSKHRVKQDPVQLASVYNGLTSSYYALGQHEKAISSLDHLIALKSELSPAYELRAFIYSNNLKQYEKAIEDYSMVIALVSSAKAYYSRGMTYYKLGQYQRAITDYDRALELDSTLSDAIMQREIAQRYLE